MTAPRRAHNRAEHGYALLMVLIAVGLIAILLGVMETQARNQAAIAIALRDQAQAQAAADGAIYNILWQVLPGRATTWPADSTIHEMTIAGTPVEVSAEDLAGRVDLNRDSAAAIAVLLNSVGVEGETALALGEKLTDWRNDSDLKQTLGAKIEDYRAAGLPYGPPNTDYENPAEMELVLGMTPQIAKALAPLVTIYSFSQPQITAATNPIERQALTVSLGRQTIPTGFVPSVFFYNLHAQAQIGHTTATRTAVVRIDIDAGNKGKFWRILDWE